MFAVPLTAAEDTAGQVEEFVERNGEKNKEKMEKQEGKKLEKK